MSNMYGVRSVRAMGNLKSNHGGMHLVVIHDQNLGGLGSAHGHGRLVHKRESDNSGSHGGGSHQDKRSAKLSSAGKSPAGRDERPLGVFSILLVKHANFGYTSDDRGNQLVLPHGASNKKHISCRMVHLHRLHLCFRHGAIQLFCLMAAV